jgi:hypothetical protein
LSSTRHAMQGVHIVKNISSIGSDS